jgi:2-methylcitrate dehydratase
MIRNYDFNDRFPGGHPSDGLGAHFALAGVGAGAKGIDGKRFLTAVLVTYEIFIRLSESSQMRTLGWDQGFAVALSAAAGICNLLGLSVEQTANAIGMTATATVPLRVTRSGELTPWKNVATAFAARNGAFAATLAAEGMIGPGNAFEGRAGLFDNITGPFDLAPFPTEGGDFHLPRVLTKYWPLETNGQPVVWAALEMREKISIDDIEAIEVLCDEFTRFEIASEPEKWDPQTRETADHSLPYIFARALVDGPLTVASFDEEEVRDAALRPLMQKIKVTTDPAIEALVPHTMMVRAIVRTIDGAAHEVEIVNPLGHPDNPMGDADIENKFRAQSEPAIGAARCDEVLEAWWRLSDAAELRPLIEMLDI